MVNPPSSERALVQPQPQHFKANFGVKFGASRVGTPAESRKFYGQILQELPEPMAQGIDQSMERAQKYAQSLGTSEVTPLHFLYGMLSLVRENLDKIAGGKIPVNPTPELNAAKTVFNALFPTEHSRYLDSQDLGEMIDHYLEQVEEWAGKLVDTPTDNMPEALQHLAFNLDTERGMDPDEIDAQMRDMMGPSGIETNLDELIENAPSEAIREHLIQMRDNPPPPPAVDSAQQAPAKTAPANGYLPINSAFEAKLMQLNATKQINASDPEADPVSMRDLVDLLSITEGAVALGPSFMNAAMFMFGMQDDLQEMALEKLQSGTVKGGVPEDLSQLQVYLEGISPLLGNPPGSENDGGIYFRAMHIAREANSQTVEPAHMVLAMVQLAEQLFQIDPALATAAPNTVPEEFDIADPGLGQKLQAESFPARDARMTLDTLINPNYRRYMSTDQVQTLLGRAREDLEEQVFKTENRMRDIPSGRITPSPAIIQVLTELQEEEITPGEVPYALVSKLRSAMGEGLLAGSGPTNVLELLDKKARENSVGIPDTTWDDLGGYEKEKEQAKEILNRLKNPEKYIPLAGKGAIPKGVLISGPPGTGKTMFAEAMANSLGLPFIACNGTDFANKYVGGTEENIRAKFAEVRKAAKQHGGKAVLFIDELDAVGSKRNGGDNDSGAGDRGVNTLLTEIQGFGDDPGVVVIGATNFPDKLDPALIRAGRLGEELKIGMPDKEARLAILKVHCREKAIAKNVDFNALVELTDGQPAAEIAQMITMAGLEAIRQLDAGKRKKPEITMADFNEAFHKLNMPKAAKPDDEERFIKTPAQVGRGNGLYVQGDDHGGVGQFLCKATITSLSDPKADPVIEFAPGTPSKNFKDMTHDSAYHALNWVTANPDALRAAGFDPEKYRGKRIQLTMQTDRGHEMDGDSAGAVMTSSMVSTLTGRKFRDDVAMTGTILIHDDVKEIGGLKYKLQGAIDGGMRVVMFPEGNLKDEWKKIPPRMKETLAMTSIEELKANPEMAVPKGKSLIVVPVNNVNDVLQCALLPKEATTESTVPEAKPDVPRMTVMSRLKSLVSALLTRLRALFGSAQTSS